MGELLPLMSIVTSLSAPLFNRIESAATGRADDSNITGVASALAAVEMICIPD
jgi:hypothetical protein